MHSLVFEAPRGSAPKAGQLARTGPERLPEGLNSCPLAGEEKEKAAGCEEGGPTWWVAAKGCSGVGAGPFIYPLRESLLPKGGWLPREGPRGRGMERARALWGLGEAGEVEDRRSSSKKPPELPGERTEEKSGGRKPILPPTPTVSCYQLKGAASGRGDRSLCEQAVT